MKTKHTPGPWDCDHDCLEQNRRICRFEIYANAQCIADVWGELPSSGISAEEAHSNAALIAAAPELLEALRELVAAIESAAAAGIDTTGHIGTGKALSAIEKAEGK